MNKQNQSERNEVKNKTNKQKTPEISRNYTQATYLVLKTKRQKKKKAHQKKNPQKNTKMSHVTGSSQTFPCLFKRKVNDNRK